MNTLFTFTSAGFVLLLAFGSIGFSNDPWPILSNCQKEWIRRRDNRSCQYPIWSETTKSFHICASSDIIHVHHIFPKRAFKLWTLFRKDPHTPNKLICLCKYHHGKIHPDMVGKKDKDDWVKTEQKRAELIERGRPYWNTDLDMVLTEISQKNTERYNNEHPNDPYPETRKRG